MSENKGLLSLNPLKTNSKKCAGKDKPHCRSSLLTSDVESEKLVHEKKCKRGKGKGCVHENSNSSSAGAQLARVLSEQKVDADDAKPKEGAGSWHGPQGMRIVLHRHVILTFLS